MEFHFRRHFRLRPKMKNVFRSASSIHHKKVLDRLGLGLGLQMQSLGLGLEHRLGLGLGLGLEIKVLVLVLVLKKSLDYITGC